MRHLRSPFLAGYLATFLGLAPAYGNPLGGQVVGGSATISGQGTSQVTVNQASDRAIINWNTFNIGTGEKTQFIQPGASSIALNRVTGQLGPSQILGTIEANGRVFLVNPDGVLFGSGAIINTAGFLATTHDITNADFMAGKNNFTIPGNPNASIVNLGTITASNAGIAALVAPGVRNSGTITAEFGKVALASNNGFTLDFYGDKLITMQVDGVVAANVKDVQTGQTLDALVKNDGAGAKLSANGGRVELTAAAARQVVDAVINNSGVVEANSVGTKNGMIVLGAATAATKGDVADTQKVKVSGTLSASGKNAGEKGGKIKITGEQIALNGARLDASGKAGGGTALVGGEVGDFDEISKSIISAPTNTSTTVTVDSASVIDVSGQNVGFDSEGLVEGTSSGAGKGGRIGIWADQSNSVAGSLFATGGITGGTGGEIYVAALTGLAFTGVTDTRGFIGQGEQGGSPHGWTYLGAAGDVTVGNNGASFVHASSVSNSLANGNVEVLAGLPLEGFQKTGSLTVADSIAWANGTILSLRADQNLTIANGATITNTDTGLGWLPVLYLRAGMAADGGGKVQFEQDAIDFSAGYGGVSIYHNTDSLYAKPLTEKIKRGPNSGAIEFWWVNTLTDLQNIYMAPTRNFALSRNIDAGATATWNDGQGFVPLAEGTAFSGMFDGQGHVITGLTINRPNEDNVGLFGSNSGQIYNVSLVGGSITGRFGVGGLVGHNTGGVVNSHSSASIFGKGNVGGLVGWNQGQIGMSSAMGAVAGESAVGGLVGGNYNSIFRSFATGAVSATGAAGYQVGHGGLVGVNVGTISESYASGAVTAAVAAGGLVGQNAGGSILDAYATGAVTGTTSVGGLAGENQGNASINRAYATGHVTGSSTVGGLVGYNYNSSVTNSFWDVATTGKSESQGYGQSNGSFGAIGLGGSGIGANGSVWSQSSYSGFDFTNTWFMIEGFTRPFLRSEWSQTITNAHQLQLMAMNVGASYTLAKNISFGDAFTNPSNMWGAQGFASIGGTGSWFSGRFDGRGHTIDGLKIAPTSSGMADIGFFGVIGDSGVVSNVNFTNAVVAANPNGGNWQRIGVLAGLNYGTVDNVSASGTISGGDAAGVTAGGLIGANRTDYWNNYTSGTSPGIVTNSSANVAITLGDSAVTCVECFNLNVAGGLVGDNDGTIINSYAAGNVTVGAWGVAGGLVGRNDGDIIGNASLPVGVNSNSVIAGCGAGQTCANGLVKVGSNGIAGGLVGENSGAVEFAYATGNVVGASGSAQGLETDEATFLGGLVGTNDGLLSNVFAFGDVLGLEVDGVRAGGLIAGGLVGGNAGMIENAFAFGSVAAGDNSVVGGLVGASLPYAFVCGSECYYLSYGETYGEGWDASIVLAGAFGSVSAGADSYVGGAVGYVDGLGGEIPSLFGVVSNGNVTAGAGSTIGGVVGMTGDGASLVGVSGFGDVSATGANSYVGGVVGYNSGALYAAAADGAVSAVGAGSYVGGLVGANSGFISTSIAVGNVTASGNASYVGGLAGLNTGSLTDVYYLASAGNGVYGTSNSYIGGLVGYNSGAISSFEVDPPVSGSGSGNVIGGAVGNNTGTGVLQNGTVIADISGGGSSVAGAIVGSNSGSISGVTFTGTVNGVNPGTPPADPPPANDPPPIDPNQYTPPTDPNQSTVNITQSSDPTPPQGGSGGQGGGAGGQGGGNGGAGNNPPPPPTGPPPGPGIGRTLSEQRFSGVPPITETRFLPGEVVVQVSNTIPAERIQQIAQQLGITLIASQAIDGSGRVVYRFSTSGGKNIRDVIRALEQQQIVASAQPNYVFGLAEAAPARRVASAAVPLPRPAPMRTAQSAPPPQVAAPETVPTREVIPAASVAPAVTAAPSADVAPPADVTGSLPTAPDLSSDLQSDMASRTTGLPSGDAAQYIIDKLRLGVVHARALGRNVTVAVIDSEIDTQHPDLQGVVSEKFDATGGASSPHAHGTGMAGAIASHRRLLGIAPGVKILAVKAFDETNTSAEATSFQILKGLDWAIAKKPRIINMSFAGPRDLMLERAMQKAYDAGIVLIAAAGNAGPKSPPLYPAADVNVIAVSASDHADKPFAMANRGKHIAVAAPGVDVLVPSPKGGYQLTTGTSVAAAHVSGVAALLLESRPSLTPKDVRRILTTTAKAVNVKGGAETFGAGLVDPFQALSTLTARSVDAAPARTLQ